MPPTSKYPGLLKRIKQALHVRKQAEVARLLGVSEAEVISWSRTGDIPVAVLLQVARFSDASVNWLLTGTGPKRLLAPTEPLPTPPDSEAAPSNTNDQPQALEGDNQISAPEPAPLQADLGNNQAVEVPSEKP